MEKFNDILSMIESRAKQIVCDNLQEHAPMLFLVGKDRITIALIPSNNKDIMQSAVEFLVEKEQVNEYYMISEGWATTYDKDKDPPRKQFIQPRYDPNRKEMLIVNRYHKKEGMSGYFVEIERVRDENDKILSAKFGEKIDIGNSKETYSRFNVFHKYQVKITEDDLK